MNAVLSGLDAGYRYIDTAQSYENEEEVGDAIGRSSIPRTEIVITTKISTPSRENPGTFEEAYDSARASLSRMQLSYVDVFLIHAPGHDAGSRRVTWQALERLVEEGRIKKIGVSNYGIKHLLEMDTFARIQPQVIQNEVRTWYSKQHFAPRESNDGLITQRIAPPMVSTARTSILLCNKRIRYSGLLLPCSKLQSNPRWSL